VLSQIFNLQLITSYLKLRVLSFSLEFPPLVVEQVLQCRAINEVESEQVAIEEDLEEELVSGRYRVVILPYLVVRPVEQGAEPINHIQNEQCVHEVD
jgi:hypothetical protein